MTVEGTDVSQVLVELGRLVQIASAILDGEEVKHIVTAEAMDHLVNRHPKHRFLAGDHYDVDQELFLRTKKLLLRIVTLSELQIGASVLVPVPGTTKITVALHNGTLFRYYTEFGQLAAEASAELTDVLKTGCILPVPPDASGRLATVLGPIRDSLGNVVGVVELTASVGGTVPAWS